MKSIGIQLSNTTGDLEVQVQRDSQGCIQSGLQVGNITQQNMALLLGLHPGEIKDAPTIGVGMAGITLDNDLLYWRTRVRQGLENEGLRIKQLLLDHPNNIYIDADY